MLTKEQLEEDVDDEGTVPSYQGMHTDYAPCEAVGTRVFESGDGYVAVIADYQDRFIETRVLFETLESIGWRRDPDFQAPAIDRGDDEQDDDEDEEEGDEDE